MNMQDHSDKWTKDFIEKAEAAIDDPSKIPLPAIKKYARMLTIYCDLDGKVSDDFAKTMKKCSEEILAVEGMEEVYNTCNFCPEEE